MAEERALGPLGLKKGEGQTLLRWLLAGLCALLTAFALSVDLSVFPIVRGPENTLTGLAALFNDLMGAVDGRGPIFLVLAAALAALYLRLLEGERKFLPSAAVVAALFALFLLVGQSYDLTDSWDPLLADPLCRYKPAVSLFRDMMGGLQFIARADNLNCMDPDIPVLFLSGADDPVGGMGRGVRKAAGMFQAAGCRDVTLKLYPGGRHEMFHEVNRRQVLQDLLSWLEDKLPS